MSTPTTSGHPTSGAGPLPAPRLAMGVVVAVFVSIGMIDFLHVLLLPNVTVVAVVLSGTCIVALTLVQSQWYARESTRLHTPLGHAVLGLQACLASLPVLVFGQAWVGMPGFLAGSVLLVLRPVLAWTAFSLVVASMGCAQWVFTELFVDTLYTAISTVMTGLVVYGLSRLTTLVGEVQESRAEIARMAVLRERLRFARDLHDLLGYSLSAITLKIELTHRLLETSPRDAADQLLEILEISRLAVSDARTVASGYRDLSIEEECRSAVAVLAAADVAVELHIDDTDLPVQVSTVLATVLREGVTNLLRHSKAKHCEITVRQARDHASIEIVNDDLAVLPAGRNDGGGCGLRNLSVRAKEIGGSVTVTRDPHAFRLRADVPLRARRCAATASEPAGFPGDPDRVDPVACGQLPDDRGEVVADGAD